jgi:tellurite resistance protein TerC
VLSVVIHLWFKMLLELLPWIVFNLLVLGMLALDLLVFHRKAHAVSVKEAAWWSLIWIALALLFNGYIYYTRGSEAALNYFTGYLIEKALSVDNLFVFLLIFKYFKTPSTSLHKVLFWGVLGAIIMRAIFIAAGIVVLTYFHWMIYLLGLLLIVTGVKLGLEKEKQIEPERNIVLRLFQRFFRVTKKYEGDQFFVRQRAGRYAATPLFVVLLILETTDVIFAVDSVPAILAITQDPFIVYTSNIFAILGLRSLYFLLSNMMTAFHFLHYGLALILVFIGVKMLFSSVMPISTPIALGVVFGVLACSVVGSLFFPQVKG